MGKDSICMYYVCLNMNCMSSICIMFECVFCVQVHHTTCLALASGYTSSIHFFSLGQHGVRGGVQDLPGGRLQPRLRHQQRGRQVRGHKNYKYTLYSWLRCQYILCTESVQFTTYINSELYIL